MARRELEKRRQAEKEKAALDNKVSPSEAEDEDSQESDVPPSPESPNGTTPLSAPSPNYEYELVGILVHTGNSSSGHYYSFIKDRCIPTHPLPTASPNSPVWFEFNDNQIRPFDLAFLDEAAFGGEQEVTERTSWGNDVITQQEKVKNAYMLVFAATQPRGEKTERGDNPSTAPQSTPEHAEALATEKMPARSPPPALPMTNGHAPLSHPPTTAVTSTPSTTLSAIDTERSLSWLLPSLYYQPLSRVIPPSMFACVARDNAQFQKDRQIFNADYFNFLIAFLRSYHPTPLPNPLPLSDITVLAADTPPRRCHWRTAESSPPSTLHYVRLRLSRALQ